MKVRLKDWRIWATASIIFLLLLCFWIFIYYVWIDIPREHYLASWIGSMIIFEPLAVWPPAVLFWISFLWFIIFWTKTDWIKKMLSIVICCIAMSWLCFFIKSKCYDTFSYWNRYLNSYWEAWNWLGITFAIISLVSIIALLLILIWRNPESKKHKKA